MPEAPISNADQIAYWNDAAGPHWVALQQRTDAVFAQVTDAALDFANPTPGEHVLDIGCGCGATVLQLARRVSPGGSVAGVDISKVMLEVAGERTRSEKLENVTLLLADAATHPFEAGAFDLAFSRFGVMFFDDPVGAFANIRRSLRPGGRLAFVSWLPLSENPWFLVPFTAAQPHLPPQPPKDPHAPGPFALADPERVREILEAAGFSGVDVVRHDTAMRLGGPNELASAAHLATRIGPVTRALLGAHASVRDVAEGAILEELRKHEGPDGIILPGSVWLVSATA